jgi:hypothetical protein
MRWIDGITSTVASESNPRPLVQETTFDKIISTRLNETNNFFDVSLPNDFAPFSKPFGTIRSSNPETLNGSNASFKDPSSGSRRVCSTRASHVQLFPSAPISQRI